MSSKNFTALYRHSGEHTWEGVLFQDRERYIAKIFKTDQFRNNQVMSLEKEPHSENHSANMKKACQEKKEILSPFLALKIRITARNGYES